MIKFTRQAWVLAYAIAHFQAQALNEEPSDFGLAMDLALIAANDRAMEKGPFVFLWGCPLNAAEDDAWLETLVDWALEEDVSWPPIGTETSEWPFPTSGQPGSSHQSYGGSL